jgi:hypothetical protein
MFGINKKVEREKQKIITALNQRAYQLLLPYREKPANEIPPLELARARILMDVAEVLGTLNLGGDEET